MAPSQSRLPASINTTRSPSFANDPPIEMAVSVSVKIRVGAMSMSGGAGDGDGGGVGGDGGGGTQLVADQTSLLLCPQPVPQQAPAMSSLASQSRAPRAMHSNAASSSVAAWPSVSVPSNPNPSPGLRCDEGAQTDAAHDKVEGPQQRIAACSSLSAHRETTAPQPSTMTAR